MTDPSPAAIVRVAHRLSREVLALHAAAVDDEGRFPEEGIAALTEAGLLGYFIPDATGGLGGDYSTYSQIATELGKGCLSTALTWVMHTHQVAVLVEHGLPAQQAHLERVAAEGLLVASVTSEHGKGGDVLRAEAPLIQMGGGFRLRRQAPVVSYGAQAAYFLITMRAAEDRPPTDAHLVLVDARDPGKIEVTGDWDALGLRGTCSVPMHFDVTVDAERVVGSSFRRAILTTLAPAAQVGWVAAWLGAAQGAFQRVVHQLRRERSSRLQSDLFLARLAELRVGLDLTQSLLEKVARRMDEERQPGSPPPSGRDSTLYIAVNNLKIAGSRSTFAAVDGLIELMGLAGGYLRHHPSGLERTFRDLRSASLMFSNERLLAANGRLILLEDSPIERIWEEGGEATEGER